VFRLEDILIETVWTAKINFAYNILSTQPSTRNWRALRRLFADFSSRTSGFYPRPLHV